MLYLVMVVNFKILFLSDKVPVYHTDFLQNTAWPFSRIFSKVCNPRFRRFFSYNIWHFVHHHRIILSYHIPGVIFWWGLLLNRHRLNMELDLQSLFGLHMHSCTHWLRPRNPPSARIWAHIRERHWSAKTGDMSLWPPLSIGLPCAKKQKKIPLGHKTRDFSLKITKVIPFPPLLNKRETLVWMVRFPGMVLHRGRIF